MIRRIALATVLVFAAHAANAETGLLILAHGNHVMTGPEHAGHDMPPSAWPTRRLERCRNADALPLPRFAKLNADASPLRTRTATCRSGVRRRR